MKICEGKSDMYRIIIESPYGSDDPEIVARNVKFARACARAALLNGESPLASHLLYTQPGILNDRDSRERALGIAAGHAWMEFADAVVLYEDLGVTAGMEAGVKAASAASRPVIVRSLRHTIGKG
jgi:hypothetical protein